MMSQHARSGDAGRTEYCLFFAKLGTDERHSLSKVEYEMDVPRLALKALWVMKEFEQRRGSFYRLHRSWATGMEIWAHPSGDYELFRPPARRLAWAAWGDEELTLESAEMRELVLPCNCVVSCADEPRTACSLSGIRHVHPLDKNGYFGPCMAHPDAPGDL